MYRKSKQIDLHHRPLVCSGDIEVVGSVPGLQSYQADKDEHTPDYSVTPLTLFPRCNATDPDAVVKIGCVNSKLTNVRWYEVLDGKKTLITSTNTDYAIVETGNEKGRITVKKNIHPLHPVTLLFYGEYVDTELTGDKYVFNMSQLLRAVDASEASPILLIDSPSSTEWNPCRDNAQKVITANLMVADMDVTNTNKCNVFWYRVLPTGALEPIVDGNGANDYEVVSVTKDKLTIDCDYIGYGITYVAKASYSPAGTPSVTPDESIGSVSTNIKRRIPALEVDWVGVPREVPLGTKEMHPKAIVKDTKGVLPDAVVDDVLFLKWYTRVNAESGVLVGYGVNPKIPYRAGMMLDLQVEDRGVYMQLVSDAGDAIVDEAGNLVMVKAQPVTTV